MRTAFSSLILIALKLMITPISINLGLFITQVLIKHMGLGFS